MYKKNLALIVSWMMLVLGLSGCGTTNMNIDQNFVMPKDESTGIVVLSTSYTGYEPSVRFQLYLQNAMKEPLGQFEMWWGDSVSGEEIFTYPRKSGGKVPDGKEIGELNVIALAPGGYEFYRYSGSNQVFSTTPDEKFKLNFKVEPNKIVYIGSLEFYFLGNKFNYSMKDRSERDLSTLKQKYPQLKDVEIIKSILEIPK